MPRTYNSEYWRLRRKIFKTEKYCRSCKAKGELVFATDLDHIKPVGLGGKDIEENLQPLCKRCHDIKSIDDRFIIEMLAEVPVEILTGRIDKRIRKLRAARKLKGLSNGNRVPVAISIETIGGNALKDE